MTYQHRNAPKRRSRVVRFGSPLRQQSSSELLNKKGAACA
ncbi:hypothetical protein APV28_0903 [Comamonas testosteroni]|nr:hypothetical protein APV28_0903 [Comamonas testosteroni]